ncbi:MAG: phosphoribosyltransferase family protein [Nostocaceae cyanobacterium]|nr:phosphoribosyltransferase family protein [Nostocaceae cyanobacterium]
MLPSPLFANRTQAGEELAKVVQANLSEKRTHLGIEPVTIVYALPRGGLPVAAPVARLLACPLTVLVAKKISHPENPELAIGAVTASGEALWNHEGKWDHKQSWEIREAALNAAMKKAQRQQIQFNPACPQVNPKGAIAILVDDGIATGMTISVAACALREQAIAEIWLCSPVAPLNLLQWLEKLGDRVIVLATPEVFYSVSNFYAAFPQVETQEALSYLQQQQDWLGTQKF